MAGTISNFGYFLIIITNNEKLIGIARATMLPNKLPVDTEFPNMTPIPSMAKTIEMRAIKETFSLKIK